MVKDSFSLILSSHKVLSTIFPIFVNKFFESKMLKKFPWSWLETNAIWLINVSSQPIKVKLWPQNFLASSLKFLQRRKLMLNKFSMISFVKSNWQTRKKENLEENLVNAKEVP